MDIFISLIWNPPTPSQCSRTLELVMKDILFMISHHTSPQISLNRKTIMNNLFCQCWLLFITVNMFWFLVKIHLRVRFNIYCEEVVYWVPPISVTPPQWLSSVKVEYLREHFYWIFFISIFIDFSQIQNEDLLTWPSDRFIEENDHSNPKIRNWILNKNPTVKSRLCKLSK